MNSPYPVECTFVSHPWAAHARPADDGRILVEVSEHSLLSHINRSVMPYDHAGIVALLDPNVALEALSVEAPRLGRIVFASVRRSTPSAVAAGLALLPDRLPEGKAVELIVHVSDAQLVASILGICRKIRIVWDLVDLPSAELVMLAQMLAEEEVVSSASWDGVHVVRLPGRRAGDLDRRQAAFDRILDDFPALRAAG